MRIALCIAGKFNNASDERSGIEGFQYLQETIIKPYTPDIFLFSSEPNLEEFLSNLYKPIYAEYSNQIDFNTIMKENNIDQSVFDIGFNRSQSPFANCSIFSTLSFLYGRKRVLNLCKLYEEKKKFKYDCIILCRYDAGQRDKFGSWQFYVSKISFIPEADMNSIYSSMWLQLNAGYADQWFYSNSDNMQLLGNAYDWAINEAFHINSQYAYNLTTGWYDSKLMNNMDPNDQGQFTNEICLQQHKKAKALMKYPLFQVVNNHLLYKEYFIETGLYEKSAFSYDNNIWLPAKG